VVVDFGCKYGHLLPWFVVAGVSEAIGVEVEDSYVEEGRSIFEALYANVRILKEEQGCIPLQPDTVDFVLVNEVISHVNPTYLDMVYAEIARVLKSGGRVLISDGNNIANAECQAALTPLYEAWENGPDGTKTDRDTVSESYLTRRRKIIQSRHPRLDPTRVDFLARNTSGLFGDFLIRVIDEYVQTGELIRRPYRRGVCPTNPSPSGVVMERGFHPVQVELALASYGLEAWQVLPPGAQRGDSANLTVIGVKRA
jgi:SAM-dependent methyltransferase